MAKKLKVWLNNKLNKRLRCTVVIKFYRIFITELVLTFFVFKCPNYFEFPKYGKRSPHLKILEIPGGRGGHQRPPGMENPGGWGGANQSVFRGGGIDIFWNHTFSSKPSMPDDLFECKLICSSFSAGFRICRSHWKPITKKMSIYL